MSHPEDPGAPSDRPQPRSPGAVGDPPVDPLLGTVIDDRFLLRCAIGEGGMGRVYLAEDLKLNRRRLALKIMGAKLTANPEFRARFAREAILQANLPHPQIIQVQDLGETPAGAYIAMEYSEGRSLARILRELGPRPLEQALDILEQVLEVLDFAHERGVIHRDLKPSNILLEQRPGREVVRLLDFGIAKLLGDAGAGDTEPLTRLGSAYGTLGYMAPEQARGDTASVDHRADIYAAGVLLFEMLTGQPPAPLDSRRHPVRYALWLQENSVPLLSESHPDLGHATEVDRMLRRALRRDPEQRYPSALAFLNDIREFRRLGTARTSPSRRSTEETASKAPPARTLKTVWAGIGAGILGLAIGFLVGSVRSASPDAGEGARHVDLANLEQRARASERELAEIRGELTLAREDFAGLEKRAEGERTSAASRVAALVQRAEQAEALAAEEARERKSVIDERDAALADRTTQAATIKRLEGEVADALRRAAENAPDDTLATELAGVQSQLTKAREARTTLEDKIRELERRPTQEAHRSLAQEKVRLEGALRTATDEQARLEGRMREIQEAQRRTESSLGTERRLRGELETWVRGLFSAGSFRLPTGIGPPPGVDVGPIACQLTIVAGSEAVIREIVAETPQGSRKVQGGQFSLSRGESRTVTLPAGTTLVRVRYDGDYNPNSRSYRIRGDVKRVEIQGSVERLDL